MAQALVDLHEVRKEMVNYLRNQDILTITQRGITTAQDTGTFASDTTYDISQGDVKNIRLIVVNAVTLVYGADYTVDFTFTTSSARITFAPAVTGAYTIDYDHGTDKIWPDYPRDDLSINSYPRISVDVISSSTGDFGVGANEFLTDLVFSVTAFSQDQEQLNDIIKDIRKSIFDNVSGFNFFRYIRPIGLGPMIDDPDSRQEILRQNVDFQSSFNVETVA